MTDKLRSKKGKQILAHITSKDYGVLEFNKMDDGTIMVCDITEHVEQLEEMHVNSGGSPTELRTKSNASQE